MSQSIQQLIENNRAWAAKFEQQNPGIFNKLAQQQSPDYLWIGCADSRVPANTIIDLQPGEVFVHRNIANQVQPSDLNVLSVMEFAVTALKVTDIILCGHYGCGGVAASMQRKSHGIVDNWINSITHIYSDNQAELDAIEDEKARIDRLCELNVMAQVNNICHTTIVQQAWAAGQPLRVHGVIYGLKDGLLKDLEVTKSSLDQIASIHRKF